MTYIRLTNSLRYSGLAEPGRAQRPTWPSGRFGTVAVALVALLALLLAACGSSPQRPASSSGGPRPAVLATGERDGAEAQPPTDLHRVPDAEPRLETLRAGGPNKPYEVLGQRYSPLAGDPALRERGLASWYGRKFHGRPTSIGEIYNMYAMTAAHKTMPLPSYARVRNPANGREVLVRVNDRGPFHEGRVIDLSYTAALKLGVLGGVAPVELERITYEAIRSGAWRLPSDAEPKLATAAVAPVIASLPRSMARPAGAAPGPEVDPIAEIARRSAGVNLPAPGASLPPGEPMLIGSTLPVQVAALSAPGYWLQLGAFAHRDGAVSFQQRVSLQVAWLAPLLAIFNEQRTHRLQAGPYVSRSDAEGAADRLREALQLVPGIVERR